MFVISKILGISISCNYGNAEKTYSCETAGDCLVVNRDASVCTCDLIAINKNHRLKCISPLRQCDRVCLTPEFDCVDNLCTLLE